MQRKIKQCLLLLCLLIVFTPIVKADQLAWITKTQAEKAVEFLQKHKQVILHCACCDNDPKEKVKIKNITYRHPTMAGEEQTDYYQVFVTVKVNGKLEEIGLDLAYVHIKQGKEAHCLGKVLSFECDPCIEPFAWKL